MPNITSYYVAFDPNGRHISTTARKDIAETDAAATGGRAIKVDAANAFRARQRAREQLSAAQG